MCFFICPEPVLVSECVLFKREREWRNKGRTALFPRTSVHMQRAGAVKANVQAANGKVTLRCVVARNSGISKKNLSSSLCWVGPEPVLASDRVFHTETQTREKKRNVFTRRQPTFDVAVRPAVLAAVGGCSCALISAASGWSVE